MPPAFCRGKVGEVSQGDNVSEILALSEARALNALCRRTCVHFLAGDVRWVCPHVESEANAAGFDSRLAEQHLFRLDECFSGSCVHQLNRSPFHQGLRSATMER